MSIVDPTDPNTPDEGSARQKALDYQREDDIRTVMSHPGGRRFVWRTLLDAGMFRASFTGERNGTDFREGMRNVALMTWDRLQKACPELLLRMQEENR